MREGEGGGVQSKAEAASLCRNRCITTALHRATAACRTFSSGSIGRYVSPLHPMNLSAVGADAAATARQQHTKSSSNAAAAGAVVARRARGCRRNRPEGCMASCCC
jgi:hypothetical protein